MLPHRFLDPLLLALPRLKKRGGKAWAVLSISMGGLGDAVLLSRVLPRFLALARPGETVGVLLRKDAAMVAS